MKKSLIVFVAGIMALVLAACNETAEPTEGTSEDQENEEPEEQADDLTAEEVYKKTLEASENMESAEVDMDMKQEIDTGDEDAGTVKMDSDFNIEMIMDPLAMHMKGVTEMSMEGADDDLGDMPAMDMEMYMVDGEMYVYNEGMDWIKMENASMDAVEEIAGQQPDPSEQLEMVEDYMDDLSMEENDEEYVLTLDADGEKFDDLVQDMIEENMPEEMLEEMDDEEQDLFDSMSINDMSMEFSVDKETFDISSLDMDMDMTMEVEDEEEVNTVQNIKADYSNINGVDDIEVPEDVKDEAVDQDEAMEQAI